MTRAATAVLMLGTALLTLVGCNRDDMYQQSKEQTWDRNKFFNDASTMRPPVPGTVSPDDADQPVPQPVAASPVLLERGQNRFNIYCAPCHGRSGDGQGMIVQRGFPRPPSFHSKKLREAKAEVFYKAITNGYGAMYSYADRVSSADRWAVIAYIRALQRSQNAKADELTPQDLAALGGKP
jgi:mono/diheme cytochrome c family protein